MTTTMTIPDSAPTLPSNAAEHAAALDLEYQARDGWACDDSIDDSFWVYTIHGTLDPTDPDIPVYIEVAQ